MAMEAVKRETPGDIEGRAVTDGAGTQLHLAAADAPGTEGNVGAMLKSAPTAVGVQSAVPEARQEVSYGTVADRTRMRALAVTAGTRQEIELHIPGFPGTITMTLEVKPHAPCHHPYCKGGTCVWADAPAP